MTEPALRWLDHRVAARLRAALWLLLVLALPGVALGHHGFSGRYDFSRPLLLEGTIRDWQSDRVHVEFSVAADAVDSAAASEDFGARLEAIEGRPFRPMLLAAGQVLRIEVDPILSRRIVTGDPVPRSGQRVRVVAYCRFSADERQGWLRVMALRLPDGDLLFSNRRSYHVTPTLDERAGIAKRCPGAKLAG